ncbi:MAG: hypothetical protein ABJN24_06540 [Hyphomicrobiales bacterium]
MRQFLYSEIAMAYGIPNVPDDPALAIEAGTQLCENILEPLVEAFGPIIIRSGFRSARLNKFGNEHGLSCAKNESNYAYHIWDHKDANGQMGASVCIVIPAFNEGRTNLATWQDLAWWIDDHIPYNCMTFFTHDNAFNIGWHEQPKRTIYSWKSTPRWLRRLAE